MYKLVYSWNSWFVPPLVYVCFSRHQFYFLTEPFLLNISMYLLFTYFLSFSYILLIPGSICSSFSIVNAVSVVLWFRIFSRAGKEGSSHSCEHSLCCTPTTQAWCFLLNMFHLPLHFLLLNYIIHNKFYLVFTSWGI